MTESNAYLAHGIMVTTESLLYAVAAWPNLQHPFHFLDLVQLRRNKGTLVANQPGLVTPSAIERVPSEVWDIVRHKVVDLELRAAEVAHLSALWCDECRAERLAANCDWRDEPYGCDSCSEEWTNYDGLRATRRAQTARDCLRSYKLALPTLVPIRRREGSRYDDPFSHFADPDTATMISLPPPPSGGADSFAIRAACGSWDSHDEQAIVDVSFSVPSNATARFRRVVRQLHLQLVVITDGMVANDGSKSIVGRKTLRHKRRHFKKIPFDALRPGWKFFTMAESVW